MKGVATIVLIFTALFFHSPDLFAGQNEIIARYSGEESIDTAPFTTLGPWVILYVAESPIEIVVRRKDGAFDNTAIQSVEAGSKGSALQKKGGTFYLDVDAYRPWHIQIRDMR